MWILIWSVYALFLVASLVSITTLATSLLAQLLTLVGMILLGIVLYRVCTKQGNSQDDTDYSSHM